MVAFIDAHRAEHGVEPICEPLPIAPSVYYEHKARQADPERLPPRLKRDRALVPEIRRVYEENFGVYGARNRLDEIVSEPTRSGRASRTNLASLRRELKSVIEVLRG